MRWGDKLTFFEIRWVFIPDVWQVVKSCNHGGRSRWNGIRLGHGEEGWEYWKIARVFPRRLEEVWRDAISVRSKRTDLLILTTSNVRVRALKFLIGSVRSVVDAGAFSGKNPTKPPKARHGERLPTSGRIPWTFIRKQRQGRHINTTPCEPEDPALSQIKGIQLRS